MSVRGDFVGWIGTYLQLTIRLSWGVLVYPISKLLGLNPVQMGLVATFFYIGYVISSVPWGLIIDRFGPIRTMFVSSVFLAGLNLFLFFFTSYVTLLITYLIEGIVASSIFPSAMKIVSVLHGGPRLTFYVALLESASPITIMSISLFTGLLINFWRFFFLVMSVTFLSFALTTLTSNVVISPSKMRRSVSVLFKREIFLATLLRFGELWATWGTTTWIFYLLVIYRGFPTYVSTMFLGLFGLGQLIGIISVEKAVNKLNDMKVILISLLAFIIFSLTLTFLPENIALVDAALLGVFSFAYRPPTDSLIMKIAGSSSAATSIGYANSISQLGTMIVPTFVGSILFLTKSFLASIIGVNVGCVLGLVALLALQKLVRNAYNVQKDKET
ncbi:MAG: MFS transporter [Metallosphaera sp.]